MLSTEKRKLRFGLAAKWPCMVPGLLAVVVAGCAPDAMNNRQATGFNGYLSTLATTCRPLVIGSTDVGQWLINQGSSDPNYSYFLDMTSRLYYGTVSPAAYRDGLTAFIGQGSTNAQAFACIFGNLPQSTPAGTPRTGGGAGM